MMKTCTSKFIENGRLLRRCGARTPCQAARFSVKMIDEVPNNNNPTQSERLGGSLCLLWRGGSKKMAISPVNAAREGTWLTDDTEKSLFGSEPKFSVIRVKKKGVDSGKSSFRNLRKCSKTCKMLTPSPYNTVANSYRSLVRVIG